MLSVSQPRSRKLAPKAKVGDEVALRDGTRAVIKDIFPRWRTGPTTAGMQLCYRLQIIGSLGVCVNLWGDDIVACGDRRKND